MPVCVSVYVLVLSFKSWVRFLLIAPRDILSFFCENVDFILYRAVSMALTRKLGYKFTDDDDDDDEEDDDYVLTYILSISPSYFLLSLVNMRAQARFLVCL